MEKILMVSDLSPQSEPALRRAALIAQKLSAELHVLHVVDNLYQSTLAETMASMAESELRRQLEKHLSAGQLAQTQVYIISGEPYIEILRFASKLPAAYAVLGMHRKQSLDLFAGTTLDRVTRYYSGVSLLARNPEVKPYKTILHATDFSPAAGRALTAAHRFSPEAAIIMVHFPTVPHAPFFSRDENARHREAYESECREKMRQQATDCLGPEQANRVEYLIEAGKPLDFIDATAARRGVDLIALGKHNRSAVSGILAGSVSRQLLSKPPCDVLTAKA
jgi:nucleotide-binding universal stress UspA family protein